MHVLTARSSVAVASHWSSAAQAAHLTHRRPRAAMDVIGTIRAEMQMAACDEEGCRRGSRAQRWVSPIALRWSALAMLSK